jgi:hypothetical protein
MFSNWLRASMAVGGCFYNGTEMMGGVARELLHAAMI